MDDGTAGSGAPWAMQLALRDDRPERPSHLAVCEAAAAAVVLLLTDPRSSDPDGEWHDPVERWRHGPIRKVVRRGRGIRFTQVEELPGVQVLRRSACVRAFVPAPTNQMPPALAKLQVGGTDQPDRGEPSPPEPGGLTIALTPMTPMTTGKAAAQCGHAAQLALEAMPAAARQAWSGSGWAVRVLLPADAAWTRLVRLAPVAVRDGGFTEVAPGTRTALAWWTASGILDDGARAGRRSGADRSSAGGSGVDGPGAVPSRAGGSGAGRFGAGGFGAGGFGADGAGAGGFGAGGAGAGGFGAGGAGAGGFGADGSGADRLGVEGDAARGFSAGAVARAARWMRGRRSSR